MFPKWHQMSNTWLARITIYTGLGRVQPGSSGRTHGGLHPPYTCRKLNFFHATRHSKVPTRYKSCQIEPDAAAGSVQAPSPGASGSYRGILPPKLPKESAGDHVPIPRAEPTPLLDVPTTCTSRSSRRSFEDEPHSSPLGPACRADPAPAVARTPPRPPIPVLIAPGPSRVAGDGLRRRSSSGSSGLGIDACVHANGLLPAPIPECFPPWSLSIRMYRVCKKRNAPMAESGVVRVPSLDRPRF